jgi:hypothetical protein
MFQAQRLGDFLQFNKELDFPWNVKPELRTAPFAQSGNVGQPMAWGQFGFEGLGQFPAGSSARQQDRDFSPT